MSNCQSEMKVPIRPAPPPPVNQKFPQKSAPTWNNAVIDDWNNKTGATVQKKKPPPRPPPPKFNNANKKPVASRPSQLIAGIFHRKTNVGNKGNEVQVSKPVGDAGIESKGNNVLTLIDFVSPPSSPTFTTRSSSDALSVNSFGSDGVTQCSGSSGNASNVESGFEDDFDLFCGVSGRKGEQPRDPWSPPPLKLPEPKTTTNYKINSSVIFPSPSSSKKPLEVSAMPTIIRSKPEGHKPQPKVNNCDTGSSIHLLTDIFKSSHLDNSKPISTTSGFNVRDNDEEDDGWSSESPPMPTCPPPAPPPEVLNDLLQNIDNTGVTEARPNGVALYDYQGEQPDDLSFRKDDIINLVRKIDENWFVGEKDGREGSVPVNFISIRVPLPGDDAGNGHVTALYAFRPEAWDDLEFDVGSVIKVTHRINQDWLYGECNGKFGQFPVNFVDRIPDGLPMRKTQ